MDNRKLLEEADRITALPITDKDSRIFFCTLAHKVVGEMAVALRAAEARIAELEARVG